MFIRYLLRRFGYMLILLALLSITAFIIIQLPPGDIADAVIGNIEQMHGQRLSDVERQQIRLQYDVDKPMVAQYFIWMGKLLRGNLGYSYFYQMPVAKMLSERVPLTILVSLLTMIVSWLIAIPIGIYSATHQYSPLDAAVTTFGFVGMATPSFLLGICLMFVFYSLFGYSTVGLFSADYINAPWTLAKVGDLAKHLPVPLLIIGTAGTAGTIRVLRGCLLDELRKQYVVTVRTKGMRETKLLFKHPVRLAMNPLVSTIGWSLAGVVSGETIVSIVLNLPTTGPLLLDALQKQDMELAGSIIMILSLLTIVGTFISDVLLVLVDPRIRFEK
jgi:peptide/nickel transport system permease protein